MQFLFHMILMRLESKLVACFDTLMKVTIANCKGIKCSHSGCFYWPKSIMCQKSETTYLIYFANTNQNSEKMWTKVDFSSGLSNKSIFGNIPKFYVRNVPNVNLRRFRSSKLETVYNLHLQQSKFAYLYAFHCRA